MQFFKRNYITRKEYKMPMKKLADVICSFKTNETVEEFYFDPERHEGFISSKSYYISYEIHQTNEGLILETNTSCKIPFNVPKTYAQGFLKYIDLNSQ